MEEAKKTDINGHTGQWIVAVGRNLNILSQKFYPGRPGGGRKGQRYNYFLKGEAFQHSEESNRKRISSLCPNSKEID